jgi:hypothetical protein
VRESTPSAFASDAEFCRRLKSLSIIRIRTGCETCALMRRRHGSLPICAFAANEKHDARILADKRAGIRRSPLASHVHVLSARYHRDVVFLSPILRFPVAAMPGPCLSMSRA